MAGFFRSKLEGTPATAASEGVIEDCLECRVLGALTCYGVAAYSWRQAKAAPANKRFLSVFGFVWLSLGCVRLVI